jgi:integrase
MKRARHKQGSVVFNKRTKTWNYLWCEEGHRRSQRIGTLREYPSKAAAWKRAEAIKASLLQRNMPTTLGVSVTKLATQYLLEKLPARANTARVCRSWIRNHILPYWGGKLVTDIQPREVELWINRIELSPKSRSHIRNMLHTLVDFAMWSGVMEIARNPIELVRVKGGTRRVKQPRSLTPDEFKRLIRCLREPFRTMAWVAVCFGLRVSELLALKWRDVDWLNQTLTIERRIVAKEVDEVKTDGSRRTMPIASELIDVLKQWRQKTQFAAETDWVFASPVKIGRLPYTDSGFWRELQRAGKEAEIGGLSPHTFRHTYRSWLDAVGTTVAVQQKMMRHSDIRTTMNIYGDVVTDEAVIAQQKVFKVALSGSVS